MLPYRENVEEKLAINKMRVFITRKKTLGTWVPKHWHPCFELLYMFCGEAVQEIEGKKILLKQGDCFLVPAGVVHSTTAMEVDSYISAM